MGKQGVRVSGQAVSGPGKVLHTGALPSSDFIKASYLVMLEFFANATPRADITNLLISSSLYDQT